MQPNRFSLKINAHNLNNGKSGPQILSTLVILKKIAKVENSPNLVTVAEATKSTLTASAASDVLNPPVFGLATNLCGLFEVLIYTSSDFQEARRGKYKKRLGPILHTTFKLTTTTPAL
jgi:hypothetical protein